MNFNIKNHMFTREIHSIKSMPNDSVLVIFKNFAPYGTEYLEISKDEFLRLPDELPLSDVLGSDD